MEKNIQPDNINRTVLVTGGSGFLGAYCILQLLQAGYHVRTTVRSIKRQAEVLEMLKSGGAEPGDRLKFFEADLTADNGWLEAIAGCSYVLHVASPFPSGIPSTEDEVIVPAKEGTLRVLRFARETGVKRVVMTSSFAAIGYGHQPTDKPFTEESWTNLNDTGLSAYVKSKTLAEKAAWDFMAREGGTLELTVINPVGIFGPVLGHNLSGSIKIIKQMLDGGMAKLPDLYFAAVDVRDVADLHIRAMTNPDAKGKRFIAAGGDSMSIKAVAELLISKMGEKGRRVSTKMLPNWLVKIVALFSKPAKQIVNDIGKRRRVSNKRAIETFEWHPRSNEEAIIATAESLAENGLLKAF
jgi:dihydroflavonol-4-reductase